MLVKSVNIGIKQDVLWNGKSVSTGIFKKSVSSIRLGKEDVYLDHVVDRKYHGGIDKACYLYSSDHYEFWQKLYPAIELSYGMFGENITIEGLNEKTVYIGDIYRIGGATVKVSQPRQPCFKLGIRFNNQKIIKEYINNDFPGIYVKVLEGHVVKANDTMELIERQYNSISLLEVWHLLYNKEIDQEDLEYALNCPHLSDECKTSLRKRVS
jgi:MOSC domain-containing protein YiiM